MKTLHLVIITVIGIVVIGTTAIGVFIEKLDVDQQPYSTIEINNMKENYAPSEPISFSIVIGGYGSGCGSTTATIIKENDSQYKSPTWNITPQCAAGTISHYFKFNSMSENTSINQTGNYILQVSFSDMMTMRNSTMAEKFSTLPNKQSTSGTTNIQNRSESKTFAEDCTVSYPATTMPIYQWLTLGGKQVNASEALLAGQSIPMPKYLPAGYDVEKFAVSKDRVTVLASKFPINSSLTNIDFMYKDRGISIYFDHVPPDQKANEIKQPTNQPEWKLININNEKGLGHEIIRSADLQDPGCSQAELIFYIGNDTQISLTALMPLSELSKIASSF